MPFLILLGVLVLLATRSEEQSYRAIMADEHDPAVITEVETRSLRSLWARRSARGRVGRALGPAGARLTAQLQAAQIDYAMIRSRTGSPVDPTLEAQRRKIRSIRAELSDLASRARSAEPGVPFGEPPFGR